MVARSGLEANRRRLADLEADVAEAERNNEPERRARADAEHQALMEELGWLTGPRRQARQVPAARRPGGGHGVRGAAAAAIVRSPDRHGGRELRIQRVAATVWLWIRTR